MVLDLVQRRRCYQKCPRQEDCGGSTKVWAFVNYNGAELMIVQGNIASQRYVDQILLLVVIPFARCVGQNFEFQDDNDALKDILLQLTV